MINAASEAKELPNAQLIELLCRNATRLDPCQSLHWPAAIDGSWMPYLAKRAKLLIMEALILMTTNRTAVESALRSLVVRLYGVWFADPSDRVRGCVGTLIKPLLPVLESLGYRKFLQGRQSVSLGQLEIPARTATANPDGFLNRLVGEKSSALRQWATECPTCHCSLCDVTAQPMMAAAASLG